MSSEEHQRLEVLQMRQQRPNLVSIRVVKAFAEAAMGHSRTDKVRLSEQRLDSHGCRALQQDETAQRVDGTVRTNVGHNHAEPRLHGVRYPLLQAHVAHADRPRRQLRHHVRIAALLEVLWSKTGAVTRLRQPMFASASNVAQYTLMLHPAHDVT